jgi:hypothetical protein
VPQFVPVEQSLGFEQLPLFGGVVPETQLSFWQLKPFGQS